MIDIIPNLIFACIVTAIIVTLLIKKNTRKLTLKILCGFTLLMVMLAVIGIIEFYLFKENFGFVYLFTIIDLFLLILLIVAVRDLLAKRHLHNCGFRTTGIITEIDYGKGSHYHVQYSVGEENYSCIGNRLTEKWQIGSEVVVIYSKDNPKESCLENEDLITSIIMTTVSGLFLVGAIILECVIIR